MTLLVGCREWMRKAVARPMPEEPPVMRTVLLVRLARSDLEREKAVGDVGDGGMVGRFVCTVGWRRRSQKKWCGSVRPGGRMKIS